MTDSLAQEEADRFFSNKDKITTHPEDASDSDNHSEVNEKHITTDLYYSDPGDDEDTLHSMAATATATYHVPHTFFDANTGPKGVIADAQSFNRAKKTSLRNTFLNIASGSYFQQSSKSRQATPPPTGSDSTEKSGSGHEDEDDEFMEQWRQSRLRELAAGGSQKHQRRQSPSKRKWGFFKEVDASGYLDAVEKTASDTVVVVCIYDPEVCPGLLPSTWTTVLTIETVRRQCCCGGVVTYPRTETCDDQICQATPRDCGDGECWRPSHYCLPEWGCYRHADRLFGSWLRNESATVSCALRVCEYHTDFI